MIERAGETIQDILYKSDPWKIRDCGRQECPTCLTSSENNKLPFKNCTKRSIIYQTWCETCRRLKTNEKVEKVTDIDSMNSNVKQNCEKLFYIGETSRSAKERGCEHFKDLE